MNKKVYFAGSIRGGRVDAELYRRIIAYVNRTDTVLTEHVGSLGFTMSASDEGPDGHIYAQDTAWLRECDLVIAECTCPSLGVGYELAYAEKLGKPCHVLFRGEKAGLSAMLTGDPYFAVHTYETEEEIYPILDEILKQGRNKNDENTRL